MKSKAYLSICCAAGYANKRTPACNIAFHLRSLEFRLQRENVHNPWYAFYVRPMPTPILQMINVHATFSLSMRYNTPCRS